MCVWFCLLALEFGRSGLDSPGLLALLDGGEGLPFVFGRCASCVYDRIPVFVRDIDEVAGLIFSLFDETLWLVAVMSAGRVDSWTHVRANVRRVHLWLLLDSLVSKSFGVGRCDLGPLLDVQVDILRYDSAGVGYR